MIKLYLILNKIKKIPKFIVFIIIGFLDKKLLCKSNHLSLIKELNIKSYELYDCFVNAASAGNLSVLNYFEQKFIVKKDIIDDALIVAARNGHLKILGYLIEKGANIKYNSCKALRKACQYGQLEIVKFLISFKELNYNKDICLEIAINNNQLKLSEYIVKKYTNFGREIINKIMERGYIDVLKIIVSKQEIILGNSVLMNVFKNGHIDMAKYLINQICEKKIIVQSKRAVLLDIARGSCLYGDVELVEYLHHLKFDFKKSLEEAVKSKNLELVKYLFELGYLFKDYKYLCIAAEGGNYDLVKFLILKIGVNMSTTKDIKESDQALPKAVKSKNIDIVKLLVSYGVKICDFAIIEALNSIDILKFLVEYNSNILKGQYLIASVMVKNYETIKYLIEKGIDISYSNYKAYKYAIKEQNYILVKLFIEKGIDLSIEINKVLEIAIQASDFNLVNKIINFAEEKNICI